MRAASPNTETLDLSEFRKGAEEAARAERTIQREIDEKEKGRGEPKKNGHAMQAGARVYPEPPLPSQHLEKPGEEAALALKPMYDAPHYKGSEKLKDKVALVTGGDSGIGRSVAVLFAREGADIAVAYLTEDKDAEETKRAVEKEGRRCILLSGDVADASKQYESQLGDVVILGEGDDIEAHVAGPFGWEMVKFGAEWRSLSTLQQQLR